MLLQIVSREISDHLKSLRFTLLFLLVTVLMVVSAVLYITDYHQQINDFDRSRNDTLTQISALASKRAALFSVFSWNYKGPWIFKKPNHLSFISEGHDRNLPNAFQPSAFRIYGPAKQVRSNILLWRSEALDWALIIGVIISFAALILVYDGISGERENGTLRLNLSNSVSRSTILLSKFLGGFVCLSSALLLGMVVHLIILVTFGNIPFVNIDWIVIGLTFFLSLIYISVFLMLGLFISSLTRESATSLVVALLCWALFVIVIPRSGGFIAARIADLKSRSEAYSEAGRAYREARKSYDEKNPGSAKASASGHWSPGEPLERALVMTDAWSEVVDDYRNRMIYQVELAKKATLISPFACFSFCLEILTESGVVHYKRFFRQVQDYKLTMRQYLLDKYPLPVKWHGWDKNFRTQEYESRRQKMLEPLDFNSIPKFQERRTESDRLINEALPYLLLLILFAVLFFAGAFVKFIRYDVR